MKQLNENVSNEPIKIDQLEQEDQLLLPLKEKIGSKYENLKNNVIKNTEASLHVYSKKLRYENYDVLANELGGEKLTGTQKENYQKTMTFLNNLPNDVKRNTEAIYENDKITFIALEPYSLRVTKIGEDGNELFMGTPDNAVLDNEVIFDFNSIKEIEGSNNSISASTEYDNFFIEVVNPNNTTNTFDTSNLENHVGSRKILEDIFNNSESFDHLSIEDKLNLLREFYPDPLVDSLPTYDEEIINNVLLGLYNDPEEFDLDDFLGPILDRS